MMSSAGLKYSYIYHTALLLIWIHSIISTGKKTIVFAVQCDLFKRGEHLTVLLCVHSAFKDKVILDNFQENKTILFCILLNIIWYIWCQCFLRQASRVFA